MEKSKEELSFIGKFLVLKGSIRELWIIFLTKILAILAYGLVGTSILSLWLSSDIKLSDQNAGIVIASWSSVLTVFTIMVGSLVDAIGIKKSLMAGFAFCIFARFIMSFFSSSVIVLPLGLLPLALGEALQTPVMAAAIRRFSSTKQRSIAFSIYYSMMNVGFAIAGWTFDKVRLVLGEYGHYSIPYVHIQISTYQTIILLSFIFTLPNLLIAYFGIRDGIEATDEGIKFDEKEKLDKGKNLFFELARTSRQALKDWFSIFSNLWKEKSFYKFLSFFAMVVFVKLILYHMYYTFPKYAIRELGEGAPIGRVFNMLNAVVVVIMAPIIGALMQKISAYKSVIIGTFISAISIFIIALPQDIFLPMSNSWVGDLIAHKWLGISGAVNPLYVSIVICVIIYSIGESFYSPRLYEYAVSIAPKGQEGSYMAMSMLPYFIAKFFVGMMSGFLLAKYCPQTGVRNSYMIWIIVASMAMITPIGLIIARPYIQIKEAGRGE